MLRIRTSFSFRSAVGSLDMVMARLKAVNAPYAAITDRASTFGFVKWEKLAKKAGLKPLLGVEIAVTPSINAKKPVIDYWTFFAKDDLGDINRLLNLATKQFRYTPLLTYEQACGFNGIRIAGNNAQLSEFGPDEDLYIGLSPSCSKGFINQAISKRFEFVALSDNKFPTRDDVGLYEVICGNKANVQTYDQHIQSPDEWRASMAHIAPAALLQPSLDRATALAEQINAPLKMASLFVPEKPKTLAEMCREGALAKRIDLNDPVYNERLARELELIDKKNFEDYFYVIADIMQFARKEMICGPARGSSCGSLVCYLLDITSVDPIPYGLLFERFIDINRSDIPDIDIDFSDDKRQLVFDYAERKYGKDHVARLGSIDTYGPRSCLKEAGAALNIPKWTTDKIVDSLILHAEGDARADKSLEDTFAQTWAGKELIGKHPELAVASRMEGLPRHSGKHAAGIVLTNSKVIDYVAIDAVSGTAYCDKKDAEAINLIKIDALGLRQLSVFEDCLVMAGLPTTYLDSVLLNDAKAFDVINKGALSGIFQYNGAALKHISSSIKTNEFNDIVATTALARPGPMGSGATHHWIRRKNGQEQVNYPHSIFEPFLNETLGILTYQEQLMFIAREIGQLSWENVTNLRRAISKSMGREAVDKFGKEFKAGATGKGVNPAIVDSFWEMVISHGSYSFNKSHSVAYAIISYWCAYLKAYFPFEFAAATLSHEGDPDKQILMLREMLNEGYNYVPVDKDLSTDKWTAGFKDGKRLLVGPLSSVKGLGPKKVGEILSARSRGEPLTAGLEKLLANPTTSIDSLFPIGDRIRQIMPNPSERNINTPNTVLSNIQTNGAEYTVLAFVVFQSFKIRNSNEPTLIAKRGYEMKGPTDYMEVRGKDDTETIYMKIDRYKFAKMAPEIIAKGRAGNCIYAVKGTVPKDFRMINIDMVRYIGDMEK